MGVGFLEIVVIGVILFGPSKLPEMMRQAARYYVQFRRASNEFKSSFDHMLRDAENSLRIEEVTRLKSLMNLEMSKLDSSLAPKLDSTLDSTPNSSLDSRLGNPPAIGTGNLSAPDTGRSTNDLGPATAVSATAEGAEAVLPGLSPRSNKPFEWDQANNSGPEVTKKVEL